MAKQSLPTNEQVAQAFETIAAFYRGGGALPGGSTAAAESDVSDVETLDEEDTRNLPIKELRALAEELGLDEKKMKSGILDELEAKGYFGDSEDDEDAADDEGDEDEEEGEYSREELEEMSLKDLKDLAKEDGVLTAAEIRKADKDALVEALLGEGDDEDEDDEDGDEDEEVLDEDALNEMSLSEVKKVAEELGLKISPRISKSKAKIVAFILENAAEEDE